MSSITMPRKLAVGLLVVVSSAALTGGAYYTWLITPPSLPETAVEGLEVIGTARYERMPIERKQEYLQRTGSLMREMTDDPRHEMFSRFRTDESARQAMREIREDQSTELMRKIAQADPAQRQQIFKEMQAVREERRKQFELRRAEWEARRQANPDQAGQPGGGDRPQRTGGDRNNSGTDRRARLQQHIETGNAQHGALRREMREFMGDSGGWRPRGDR